jgi:hypothetical protein
MKYGNCTICNQEIEESEALIVTGVTIIGGHGLADENRSTEVHYAHQSCRVKPRPNHLRDAIEANQ